MPHDSQAFEDLPEIKIFYVNLSPKIQLLPPFRSKRIESDQVKEVNSSTGYSQAASATRCSLSDSFVCGYTLDGLNTSFK